MSTKCIQLWHGSERPCEGETILVTSDGGSRKNEQIAAYSCTVSVLRSGCLKLVAAVGIPRAYETNVRMEFEGAALGVQVVASWLRGDRLFEVLGRSADSGAFPGAEFPTLGNIKALFR